MKKKDYIFLFIYKQHFAYFTYVFIFSIVKAIFLKTCFGYITQLEKVLSYIIIHYN